MAGLYKELARDKTKDGHIATLLKVWEKGEGECYEIRLTEQDGHVWTLSSSASRGSAWRIYQRTVREG